MYNKNNPYLSIVTNARNTHVASNLLNRLALFIRNISVFSQKYKLYSEVIIVEWNPAFGKKRLRETLENAEGNEYCTIRYIEVPQETHEQINHNESFKQFNTRARNVGIRRAKASFVLCTNPNVLFSESLFSFLAQKELKKNKLYRTVKYDLELHGEFDLNDILADPGKFITRKYFQNYLYNCKTNEKTIFYYPKGINLPNRPFDNMTGKVFALACEDFQLLDKESWERLHGYPEFDAYSYLINQFLEFQAKFGGITEVELSEDMPIYHLNCSEDHKPEVTNPLNSKATDLPRGMLEYEDLRQHIWQMHYKGKLHIVNTDKWGLNHESLSESTATEKLSITIICSPKAFSGEFNLIQRNAIVSWKSLQPEPEIILMGDEKGYKEVAEEFGLKHCKDIAKNELGTPLISSIIEKGQHYAKNDLIVYLNSDIILLPCFTEALRTVLSYKLKSFLMVGHRLDFNVTEELTLNCYDQLQNIKERALQEGLSRGIRWIDYFAFTKGLINDMPPFTVGRPCWDQWFIWNALIKNAAVIDSSNNVTAVHQTHSYNHVPGGHTQVWYGEEAKKNQSLSDNRLKRRHIGNANMFLEKGILYLKTTGKEIAHSYVLPRLPKNEKEALNCNKSTLEYHQENILTLADNYYINNDTEKAYHIYHRLAIECLMGDAMINLSEMSARGNGIPKDPRITAYWLRKCSKLKSINGNNHYGIIFENWEHGINPIEFWKNMYATADTETAAYLLGISYLFGLGVSVDITEALLWFSKCKAERAAIIPKLLCFELEERKNLETTRVVATWLANRIYQSEECLGAYFIVMLKLLPFDTTYNKILDLTNEILKTNQKNLISEAGINCILNKYPHTPKEWGKKLLIHGKTLNDSLCAKYLSILKSF